jgi:mono/diheme cytochrome c family protein
MKTHARFGRPAALTLPAIACLFALDVSWAVAQQGRSKQDPSAYVALANVPDKARAKRNPLESDLDAVAAGGKLFDQHCAECHGVKAEGTKRAPSLLTPQVQQAPPGAIFWVMTNGIVRRGMPVWSKLPELQRWQIVTFVKRFTASTNRHPAAAPLSEVHDGAVRQRHDGTDHDKTVERKHLAVQPASALR